VNALTESSLAVQIILSLNILGKMMRGKWELENTKLRHFITNKQTEDF